MQMLSQLYTNLSRPGVSSSSRQNVIWLGPNRHVPYSTTSSHPRHESFVLQFINTAETPIKHFAKHQASDSDDLYVTDLLTLESVANLYSLL